MCPYARFQSVMFNENTMIVGYDKKRGEPRGSRSRSHEDNKLGDCVDCRVCVQVCPVGIDIRDGLQYECIGCALCIDACDSIMTKMNYDTGLIRYASEKELEQGKRSKLIDARTIGYGALLLLAIALFITLTITRPLAELSVLRDRGPLYQDSGLGQIINSYTLRLINKREYPDTFKLSVDSDLLLTPSQELFEIGAGEIKTVPISVEADAGKIQTASNEVTFRLQSTMDHDVKAEADSKFLGPVSRHQDF